MTDRFILASGSAARRAMLASAGLDFEIVRPDVDEEALKATLAHLDARDLALELARAKALAVSKTRPGAWVLGSDQTLEFNGRMISKAADLDEARRRLAAMRGRDHALHSAAALARNGAVVWSGADSVEMRMRQVSDAFLDAYLAAEGDSLLEVVGSYRLEGRGAQLFSSIDGDHFTVLGLPLWAVLTELRRAGVIQT